MANSLSPIHAAATLVIDGKAVAVTGELDKSKIFLYAYPHTYAQRHADAGVGIDVLCELMDHENIDTTRAYFQVGHERRRAAVDKVSLMQFDRHGNRAWREAEKILESERLRQGLGQVAVPYGTCSEPSNVQAGGGRARSASAAWAASTSPATSPTCPTSKATSPTCCATASGSPR